MMGGNVNPYPVLLLVNYWEISTASVAGRLDELIKRGVTQVGTYIPWQAAESDISHALIRFLQVAAERQINVFLILSPEVGIHYPNSGLPKNLVSKKENLASHFQADKTAIHLPPNSYGLPSYFSGEFNKRYYSYLARMDSLFGDLLKNQPSIMKRVTVSMSGSFWKYYRSPRASTHSPFGAAAGDYSAPAALAFRQRMEHLYSQREFSDPNASASNRWKTRGMEDINRRWFYQHSEDVFRFRSHRAIRKKSANLKVSEFEIFTPEADPAFTYLRFIQMVSGVPSDFARLSSYLDEATARTSLSDSFTHLPMIHWSSMGGFRNLSESEKQFLILKSILLTSTRGGGIIMEDGDWLSLSPNFRTRIESLIRTLTHEGEFQLKNPVLYLSPHLWSSSGTLWEELSNQLGHQIRMISSIEGILRERQAHMLVVDPSFILTRETVQKLTAWAKAGRMLVLPRSTLFTEAARTELERAVANTQKIEITMGLSYSLHAFGNGKLIVYEVPATLSAKRESLSAWQTFINGILAVGEIQSICRTSDNRLKVVCFEIQKEGLAVFVMNSSRRAVQADIIFPAEVRIADLGGMLSQQSGIPPNLQETDSATSHRFSLNVPSLGVLPLKVEGLDLAGLREKQLAAMNARETEENAFTAALSELPGLGSEGNIEEIWS